MKVRYSYLEEQFAQCDDLWAELKQFVKSGDFTLGQPLTKFEELFANLIGSKYAIGVNSGTDAIKLSLKALGISKDDEVITAANTFVATVGAIAELGAIPVFVDCDDTFCINPNLIERAITNKTKAIVPVHLTGNVAEMEKITAIGNQHNIRIVEDSCQAILGQTAGKNAGTWGITGAFSLHPLKNLNVWADGGVIVTDDETLAKHLRLLRNHGLSDRDTVSLLGCNSRLDTFQAIVATWLLPKVHHITSQRIANAHYYDHAFGSICGIDVPTRTKQCRSVYHLYMLFSEKREELLHYCIANGVEAKVHYPTPIYRQPALEHLGYTCGDFPITDRHAKSIISFPCDQHLTEKQLEFVIHTVREFFQT